MVLLMIRTSGFNVISYFLAIGCWHWSQGASLCNGTMMDKHKSPAGTLSKQGRHLKNALSESGERKDISCLRKKPLVIPYVSVVLETLIHIFSKHQVSVAFKPQTTLSQRLVYPKVRVPQHKQNDIVSSSMQ